MALTLTFPDSGKLDVQLRAGHVKAFNGWIEEATLPDLMQLACLEGSERIMVIQHEEKEGFVYFSGGEVVHAVTPGNEGEQAFYEIMTWQAGIFELRKGPSPEKTIEVPWNFLLIEALRRMDEGKKTSGKENDEPLKVLVVDDSKVVCNALKKMLHEKFQVEVIGEASNGVEALKLLDATKPDAILMDVNMPVMGGDLALKHIMIKSPAPVVLVSGLSSNGGSKVMEFLRLGAVDFVPKPLNGDDWSEGADRLSRSLSMARELEVHRIMRAKAKNPVTNKLTPSLPASHLLVIIGGLGGHLALQKILPSVAGHDSLAMVVMQDMAGDLVRPAALHLEPLCRNTILPLETGGRLLSNQCWLANWDISWEVISDDNGAAIKRYVNGSTGLDINKFLSSASRVFAQNLMVLVLSGADLDMENGLLETASHGGRILLQDAKNCLCPAPLKEVEALELDDGCVDPSKADELIDNWFSLGAGSG